MTLTFYHTVPSLELAELDGYQLVTRPKQKTPPNQNLILGDMDPWKESLKTCSVSVPSFGLFLRKVPAYVKRTKLPFELIELLVDQDRIMFYLSDWVKATPDELEAWTKKIGYYDNVKENKVF